MRWVGSLTILALALPSYAGDMEAEKLFRQMEKKIREAKTVQFRSDAAMTFLGMTGSVKANVVFGEGDKFRVDADVSFFGEKNTTTVTSDGTKMVSKSSDTKDVETKKLAASAGAFFRSALSRAGNLSAFGDLDKGKELPKIDKAFKVSDFKLGAKEKLGEVDTRVVTYTVLIGLFGDPRYPASAKVWIDTLTNLPVKLNLRSEASGVGLEINETYTDFTIDGKVDAKLFELPK
jgi:outer membrane lipoprotein-sorting protein